MPTTAVETEVIENAVQTACRAPSLHNSQPWQWTFNRGQLRLFLDPSRVMDTDHSAREALISCGAALDHLRVVRMSSFSAPNACASAAAAVSALMSYTTPPGSGAIEETTGMRCAMRC